MNPRLSAGRFGPFRRAIGGAVSFLALAGITLPAQDDALDTVRDQVVATAGARAAGPLDRVVHDVGPDGRLWAVGADWKASFGRDGFTYVPRFGPAAPSSPLQFRVAAVRVGGRPLAMTEAAKPVRDGDVVTIAHGPVREVYTLGLERVEQDVVVDTGLPGDIEVELALTTDLRASATDAGLRFVGDAGSVDYTDAFVRRGAERLPIAVHWDGASIRLHVAADQRGDGPVWIDPILSANSGAPSGSPSSPDVAYDAVHHTWLMAYEVPYSATDHDLWCQAFDASGTLIPGTTTPIDITADSARHPRTANLRAADRFLIAFELADSFHNGRHMIYSRTRDAGTTVVGAYKLLSDPNLPGENRAPEVGADPDANPSSQHDWLVVWSNVVNPLDANVHGRAVAASGLPLHPWVMVIEDGVLTYNTNVQVSRSNGNGQVPHPMWLVVYSRYQNTYVRVYGRTIDLGFNRGAEVPIDDSNYRNQYPQVSSPIVSGDRSAFLVTYERETPATARAVAVTFDPAWSSNSHYDLTLQFGMIGQWLRAESDGVRFVVVGKGPLTNDLNVQTFALVNNVILTRQDGPWGMGNNGTEPEIASCRASGGGVGEYAIAWVQNLTGPASRLTRYGGYQAGGVPQTLATQCHGLDMTYDGTPLLGDAMHFDVTNPGGDLPGFVLGAPAANPIPICSQCSLGLRIDLPIAITLGTSSYYLPIPPLADLVGQQFAVQGLGVGPWSCLDLLRFSDTVVCTIR